MFLVPMTSLLTSYLVGSIPFGLILSKYFLKLDVRKIGSGNIGATNVLRTGNKKVAMATLFFDALKGFLPVALGKCMGFSEALLFSMAVAAVLGHIFPLWLRFRGGKGVATALGVLLALNAYVAFFVMVSWILVAKIFRISSLAALVAFALSPFVALCLKNEGLALFCLALAALLTWTHRENIQRLVSGKEGKF